MKQTTMTTAEAIRAMLNGQRISSRDWEDGFMEWDNKLKIFIDENMHEVDVNEYDLEDSYIYTEPIKAWLWLLYSTIKSKFFLTATPFTNIDAVKRELPNGWIVLHKCSETETLLH